MSRRRWGLPALWLAVAATGSVELAVCPVPYCHVRGVMLRGKVAQFLSSRITRHPWGRLDRGRSARVSGLVGGPSAVMLCRCCAPAF